MANPEIPSFKNPQGQAPKDGGGPPLPKKEAAPPAEAKEEKKGGGIPLFGKAGAKPPTFGGAPSGGGTPSLKIRGLAGGPRTLLERLKQFQKKDLVFIASGMGVLFLAPLAEHFMMSPTQDGALKGGFDDKRSGSMFGPDVGVQEVGTGLASPGGLYGASTDVITPLNVRDPSALVMAPGASQVQPPPAATTVAPPAASGSRDTGGWKDALSAAKSGAEKGAEAAKPSAFRAPGNLAGALRGLSALSGGSYGGGPTFNLGAPNASNVPNRSGEGGRLSQVKSAPGYKGVGQRGLDSGGGGAEALRKAAENQGNLFNRPGSASGNLDAAAREAIPTGSGAGGGGPGSGGENKGGSGSTSKDNKALGESLAYLRMKMEMEKEMDLKWSKKKWKEFEFPKMIYEELTKSAIQNIAGKGMFEPLGKAMAGAWAAAAGKTAGVACLTTDSSGEPQTWEDDGESVYSTDGKNVFKKKADGTGNQQINTSPYFRCWALGGGSKTDGAGSGSGRDGRPRVGAPGTEDERQQQERQRSTQGIGEAGTSLQGFLATCKPTDATDNPQKFRLCEGAKHLAPLYDQGGKIGLLTTANNRDEDASAAMGEAWRNLRLAAEKMQTTAENALAAANKLCAAQGKDCGADTAVTNAEAAQAALKEAAKLATEAIPLKATDPVGYNGKVQAAAAKYKEAQEALAKAQAFKRGADERKDIRDTLAAAETKLIEATTKAREGGDALSQARTGLGNATNSRYQSDEFGKMKQLFLDPAATQIDGLSNRLGQKAGDIGRKGGNQSVQIANEAGSGIQRIDAIRTARGLGTRDTVCGDCANDGAPPPGGNAKSLVREAIAAYSAAEEFKKQQLPAIANPGDHQPYIDANTSVTPKLEAQTKPLRATLVPNFQTALGEVGKKNVPEFIQCAGSRSCAVPTTP